MLEGDDGRSAVRLIAINKTLRAEAERLLPTLAKLREPAEQEEILAVLVRHAPHYGVQAKSGAEWAALFGAYLDALNGLSVYEIEDAFVRWNRGEAGDLRMVGFYPKSGQLHLLAQKAKHELAMAAYRARLAAEYVEKQLKPPPTPEEKAERGEQLRDLLKDLQRRQGANPLADPTPSRTREQVSNELRAMAPKDDVGDVL